MYTFMEPARTALDVNFQIVGTRVRVSAWFWILPGLIGLAAGSFLGVWYSFLVPACFFLSVLLHEFGHVLAGRRFGQRSYVVLNGFGGIAVGAAEAFERWQRVVVYAAGPSAQLLFGGVLWLSQPLILRYWQTDDGSAGVVANLLSFLVAINLFIAIVNLVPIWPLDGWHIAMEGYQCWRGWNKAPWEQSADWWKAGSPGDTPWEPGDEPGLLKSNRLPIALVLTAIVVAAGWSIVDHYHHKTATALMQ